MLPADLVDPVPHMDDVAADDSTCSHFASVEAYLDDGYRRGYNAALQNLLESLVPLAEAHLRSSPGGRRHVYAFIEYLERHVERAASENSYVSDGLGI